MGRGDTRDGSHGAQVDVEGQGLVREPGGGGDGVGGGCEGAGGGERGDGGGGDGVPDVGEDEGGGGGVEGPEVEGEGVLCGRHFLRLWVDWIFEGGLVERI